MSSLNKDTPRIKRPGIDAAAALRQRQKEALEGSKRDRLVIIKRGRRTKRPFSLSCETKQISNNIPFIDREGKEWIQFEQRSTTINTPIPPSIDAKGLYLDVNDYFKQGLKLNCNDDSDVKMDLFQNLQHGLFEIIYKSISLPIPISPFNYALANRLYSNQSERNRLLSASGQTDIFTKFGTIVKSFVNKFPNQRNDKIANEIQFMSAIAARVENPGVNISLPIFNNDIDLGAVGLFLSLGFIVPRNAKGQSQARSILENPGSSWSNGQCEHAYAAYGLKIVQDPDNKFYWYSLRGITKLAPVCCYMCRTPLDRSGGPRSMECEHKKPFMRGITDWSLLIKSLFIDEYKAMGKGEWRSETVMKSLNFKAYIWLLLSSLEYAPSCKSCNQKTGKSNIPLEEKNRILQKFTDNKTSSSSLGSNGQYNRRGGKYYSGIINTANFFRVKGENTVEQKLIKFLFALSDESVLQSIISLYRRGKSINPMQKVLDELKIVAKILSDNQTQVNDAIEIRKQQITDALETAKVIEENCLAKIEMLKLKPEQEEMVFDAGRGVRSMQRAADAAAAAAAAAAQALDEQLQTAKQAIIDTRNDQKTFGNLIINPTTIVNITRYLSDFLNNSRENGKTFLNKLRQFTKNFTQGEPTKISKIIDFFVNLEVMVGGKGNKIYQSGGGPTIDWNELMGMGEEVDEVDIDLIEKFTFCSEEKIANEIIKQLLNDKYGNDGEHVQGKRVESEEEKREEKSDDGAMEEDNEVGKFGNVFDYYINEIKTTLLLVLEPFQEGRGVVQQVSANGPVAVLQLLLPHLDSFNGRLVINSEVNRMKDNLINFIGDEIISLERINEEKAPPAPQSSAPNGCGIGCAGRGGKKHTKKLHKRKKHTKKLHKRKKNKRKKHKKKHHKRKKHTKKHHKRKKHTRYKKKNAKQKTKRKKYTRYKN